MTTLVEKIKSLPDEPGVYLMKGDRHDIIYVGKAKNLKNRVSSYFHQGDHSPKTRALVADIQDFDLIICHTEVEALLLERTLIRHHQPRYNILLRDDKEYPYVRVNFLDPWPRIEKVRRYQNDGATYIGPFGNAGLLAVMLKMIYRIFPLIRCTPHEFKNAKRPCNYYHMKMCLGPCTLPVSRDTYVGTVRDALALLEGRNRHLVRDLQTKMGEAASTEKYELAAHYRDQINALKGLSSKQVVIIREVENADVIAFHHNPSQTCFHALMIRDGVIMGGDNFLVESAAGEPEEALTSFLLQYYGHRVPPEQIILPIPLPDHKDLEVALAADGQKPPHILHRQKGVWRELLEMAHKNAKHHGEQEQRSHQRKSAELEMVRDFLNLPTLPHRMECIDISNLQGGSIVASNVCFIDGKPAKDHYRHYTVKTVTEGPDDFASMREVVTRRLERAVREDDAPDVLVIDGGKGQLSAALDAAAEFPNLTIPLVALAKSKSLNDDHTYGTTLQRSQERIFFPHDPTPHPLEEGSSAYRLLVQLRDEAHRFAITFHRKKRAQQFSGSILDDVPGIGPKMRQKLLQTFGSMEALQHATWEQLMAVPGMREKTAEALISQLKGL